MKQIFIILCLFIVNTSIAQLNSLQLDFDDFKMIKDEKLKKELKNVFGKLQHNLMILEESDKTIVFGSRKKINQPVYTGLMYNTTMEAFYTYAFDRKTMKLKHALKHQKGTLNLYDINCKDNGDVIYYYRFALYGKHEKGTYYDEYYYSINDGEKIPLKNSEYTYERGSYIVSGVAYSNNGKVWGIARTGKDKDKSKMTINVYDDLEWQFQKEIKLPNDFQNKAFSLSNPMSLYQFPFNTLISDDMKTIYLIKKRAKADSEKGRLELLIYNCETGDLDDKTITIDRNNNDTETIFYSLINDEFHVFGLKSDEDKGGEYAHLNSTLFYNVHSFPNMSINTASKVKISDREIAEISEKSDTKLTNKNTSIYTTYINHTKLSNQRYFYITIQSKNFDNVAKVIYQIDDVKINKNAKTFILPKKLDTKEENYMFWQDKYYYIFFKKGSLTIHQNDGKTEKLVYEGKFSINYLHQSLIKGEKGILIKERNGYHYIPFSNN